MKKLVLSTILGLSLANANSNVLNTDAFKKLIKSKYPNYCLTKNKFYFLDYKNDFGEYTKTKFPAALAVLGMREHSRKIEFNRDIDRIYFLAFLIKNNNIFKKFLSKNDKDDEIFYYSTMLSSYLRYGGSLGYIPLTNLTIENLKTKKASFTKKVSSAQIANGLINYFASGKTQDEINKRILLLASYILAHTNKDPLTGNLKNSVFSGLKIEESDMLILFLNTILKNTKNPKIQDLIYFLVNKNGNLVKYMLHDKKTKELFYKALQFYKKAKIC